jgi:acetate kinase
MRVLTLNVGGATAKLAAYALDGSEPGLQAGRDLHRDASLPASAFANEVVDAAVGLAETLGVPAWDAVAHRIVHGGTRYRRPCLMDAAVLAAIGDASPLAPLHNPVALAVVDAVATHLPAVPQVAVFDTGFFANLPDVARGYAVPASLGGPQGLVRCGFHGLAHAAMWEVCASMRGSAEPTRVISLQLGSGASVAAVRDGRALDVSMGYSTLEGLVMGTRCGDIDPGALLQLLQRPGSDPQQLADQLAFHSGLLGVSGRSAHVHELLQADDDASRHALALYVYRATRYVGSYLAVLGGVDAIVFGGGVGEHSPEIRARILAPLGYAGIRVDESRNRAATAGLHDIGAAGSAVRIFSMAVDEGRQLAIEASRLVGDGTSACGGS